MYFNQEMSYRIITGSNINLTNEAANAEWISSTNYTDIKDQLVVNFGTASTKDVVNDADTDANRIYFEFSAIVNEHPAIANGSNISVVVGVIGKPYMVWMNQVDLKTYIDPNSAPVIDFLYSTQNKRFGYIPLKLDFIDFLNTVIKAIKKQLNLLNPLDLSILRRIFTRWFAVSQNVTRALHNIFDPYENDMTYIKPNN